jgi:hypothetical protein
MTYLKRDATGQLSNKKRFNVKRGWPTGDHLEQNAEWKGFGSITYLPGQIVQLEEDAAAENGKVFSKLSGAWDGSKKLWLIVEGSQEFTAKFTRKGTAVNGPILYEVDEEGFDGALSSYTIGDALTVEDEKVKLATSGDPVWGHITGIDEGQELLEIEMNQGNVVP